MYISPAESLLAGHGYTLPGALRTPTYPMFLAFFFALFGKSLAIIAVVQVIVSSLTVVLTYQAGVLLLPRRAAWIGALLLALSLESMVEPFFILTDTLFTFLFLVSAYTFFHYRSTKRISWLISSAILMGFSILCRPIAVYYPVAIVFLLGMVYWKQWISLLTKSLIYLAVVFGIVAVWLLRSDVVDGAPILSTISNYNFLFYNAASLDSSLHGGSMDQYKASYPALVQTTLDEKSLTPTEANLDRVYKSLSMEKTLAHPVQYAFVHMKDDLKNLLPGWASTLEILAPSGQGGIQGAEVLVQKGLSGMFQTYFAGRVWIFSCYCRL